MPSTGIGVYGAGLVENDEVSSTYEGRHLTFLEADITGHEHSWPTKGHPVVVGEHIVGVALKTGAAVDDLIAIDTEGVWALSVYATDEDGNVAVVAGDELYIDRTTGLISKNNNKNTHTLFGYALGGVPSGVTPYIIAVKVHWNPDDSQELVGQQGASAVMFTSARASNRFREYHYEATGGGYPHGLHIELNVATTAVASAQALVAKVRWTNATNLVGGYCAAGEFELEVGGGAGLIDNMYCIHLTSHIGVLTTTGTQNVQTAWMAIDEYAGEAGSQIRNLLRIADTDSDYPYTTDATVLFTTLAGDVAATHAVRFIVNNVAYWFLCRNAIT